MTGYHLAELNIGTARAPTDSPEMAGFMAGIIPVNALADGDLVTGALAAQGYQPYRDGGDVRLRNCPVHVLADRHPPLICGMNLALLEGLLSGAAVTGLSARLDPRPGECCVVLQDSKNNAD